MLGLCIVLSIMVIMSGLVVLQRYQHEFLIRQKEYKDSAKLSIEIEQKLKEFDEYKKRVDALVLKAGFKL